MIEIKQAEFFALTGGTYANTIAQGSNSSAASATDDQFRPIAPSLLTINLDKTFQYYFYGYIWGAYSADQFSFIRGSIRFSLNGTDLARLPLVGAYKQGTGNLSIAGSALLGSAFTWGTTQAYGDIGFNPVAVNGNSQGEGNASVITFLHRRDLAIAIDRIDLDIIGWANLDTRNVHAYIAAVPAAPFTAQLNKLQLNKLAPAPLPQ